MKWVLLGKRHINTNNVDVFMWEDGTLYIGYSGYKETAEFEDPDRELYLKLCRQQGIRPYEEE